MHFTRSVPLSFTSNTLLNPIPYTISYLIWWAVSYSLTKRPYGIFFPVSTLENLHGMKSWFQIPDVSCHWSKNKSSLLANKIGSCTPLRFFSSCNLLVRFSQVSIMGDTRVYALRRSISNHVRIESLYRRMWSSVRNIKRAFAGGILMDQDFHTESRKTKTIEKIQVKGYVIRLYITLHLKTNSVFPGFYRLI
jgi:hypothetical protein